MLIGFLIVLIYIMGWFVSYAVLSRAVMKCYEASNLTWGDYDRRMCASVSLSSWVGALFASIMLLWFICLDPMDLDNSFIDFLKKLEK